MNGNDIVIVSATRTAIGKFGGQFATSLEMSYKQALDKIQHVKSD